MEITELQKLEMGHALRDCRVKLAALPERLKEEFLDAVQEGRQPYTLEPLTAIRANLVHLAIQMTGDAIPAKTLPGRVPVTLKEVCRVQSKSCGPRRVRTADGVVQIDNTDIVALTSEHLRAILEAAGIKELGEGEGGIVAQV